MQGGGTGIGGPAGGAGGGECLPMRCRVLLAPLEPVHVLLVQAATGLCVAVPHVCSGVRPCAWQALVSFVCR